MVPPENMPIAIEEECEFPASLKIFLLVFTHRPVNIGHWPYGVIGGTEEIQAETMSEMLIFETGVVDITTGKPLHVFSRFIGLYQIKADYWIQSNLKKTRIQDNKRCLLKDFEEAVDVIKKV